ALIAQYPTLEETDIATQHEPDNYGGDEMADGLKGRDSWDTAWEVANDVEHVVFLGAGGPSMTTEGFPMRLTNPDLGDEEDASLGELFTA
ncbi:hypothetical protein Daus18300_013445, partial [Diaporthe australafricana]